jgi:SAM-dependent methyltransferase
MLSPKAKRVEWFVGILRDQGVLIDATTKVMDLGCGAGKLVQAARERGYDFHGCGLGLRDAHTNADDALVAQGILRDIHRDPYRLPYDDCTFDVVISDQVLEHVMDYPTTLREVQRVMKPGGAFLHVFPPRYMPIEPHARVPLATMLRHRWWLKTWALVGIRNEFQTKMSAQEACEANHAYLTSHTNYLTKRQLRQQFGRFYTDVRFVEDAFLKHRPRGGALVRLAKRLPFLCRIYSAVGSRVAFGRRPTLASMPAVGDATPALLAKSSPALAFETVAELRRIDGRSV